MRSDEVQSKSLLLIMENCLAFTDDVMEVLVHKCVQQIHLLALHLETLGYIPRLLNALNGLVYFLIIGDPRGDNLMVGSISRNLLISGSHQRRMPRFKSASKAPSFLFTFPKMSRSPK